MNARNKDSCQLFKNIKILPLNHNIFFPFYFCCQKYSFVWIKFRNS